MKECTECGEVKDLTDFYKAATGRFGVAGHCKECHKERMRRRGHTHKSHIQEYKRNYYKGNKDAWRDSSLINLYGITLQDYDDMLEEQDGCCAICGTDDPKGKGRFHVDHCHDTLTVRGLLCHHCNLMLGHAKDDVDTLLNAVEYLRHTKFGSK